MTKITPLMKPIITNVTPSDERKICTFATHNNILGELTTSTRTYPNGHNTLITELKNKLGKVFGHEIFNLDKDSKSMFGFSIEVNPEYRSSHIKGFKFGETIRISSLITMLENGVKKFGIFSKDTAVYFHSKYHFEPQITKFIERNNALQSILKNTAGQEEFKGIFDRAAKIMSRIQENPSAEEHRELARQTTALTTEYIKQVQALGVQKSHPFSFGMDMILTDENIVKNKDFFNALFHKHGIDYRI